MRRSDEDDYGLPREETRPRERSELLEAVDQLSRRVSGALMLAGGLVGLGLYAGSGSGSQEAPRYQVYAADGEVFRLNTDSGTIIACNGERCMRVLERGQDLAEDQAKTLFRRPAAAPQSPALQPPAAAPQQLVPPAPGTAGPPVGPDPSRK